MNNFIELIKNKEKKITESFIGKEALTLQKEKGVEKKWVGLELKDRGIPRPGYTLTSLDGHEIGKITSGTHSPTLKKSIAMASIQPAFAEIGTAIQIDIRGKKIAAEVIQTPFYKRGSA